MMLITDNHDVVMVNDYYCLVVCPYVRGFDYTFVGADIVVQLLYKLAYSYN